MIALQLTRTEFQSMILFLRRHTQYQEQVPLINQAPVVLVLIDYLASWKTLRLLSWSQRRADKTYRLSLKPVVAISLHQEMQHVELSGHQQLLLNKLDQAIINYRDPNQEPHVLGELIG